MAALQRHRGPDSHGIRLFRFGATPDSWSPEEQTPPPQGLHGGVAFNRLSILDLSANGHQPMVSASGKTVLAFNGEIYNAFQLRPELEAAGVRFRSNTDTEVILYLYERYGMEGTLARLNGMFSILVVDLAQRRICVARDRLGIKPVYWTRHEDSFYFASEIKSFLAVPGFAPQFDPADMGEYLLFRYVGFDRTLFANVRQLEPGCWMELRDGDVRTHRYWSPPPRTGQAGRLSLSDTVEALEERVGAAVRTNLLADVTVGTQLSGGVDSSLVSYYAAAASGAGRMEAFTVVPDRPDLSEESWARIAAEKADVRLHCVPLGITDIIDDLDAATWHADQPISIPNALGIFRLAREARSLLTVLLSGEGADEIFAGYHRYLFAPMVDRFGRALAPPGMVPGIGPKWRRRFGSGPFGDSRDWFLMSSAWMGLDQAAALLPGFSGDRALAERRRAFARQTGDVSFLGKCLAYDTVTYLPDLLIRQDKMTMAHSVENRVPLLDHTLAEFVATLPLSHLAKPGFALDGGSRSLKIALKALCARHFGQDFAYRNKMGFGLPISDLFAHPLVRDRLHAEILPTVRDVAGAETAPLAAALDRGQVGGDMAEVLWTVLAFGVWHKVFFSDQQAAVGRARGTTTDPGPSSILAHVG